MSNHYSEENNEIGESTSRRQFLQRFGLASSAFGVAVFGGLTFPKAALAQCDPPGSPGTPQPWRRDCRPIRPRRPASTLDTAAIQKLKDAYNAMRALDTSDPNDPRAFQHQANIHCWFCGQGTQIHFSWQFFVWHRAYLYFHERILGKLVGDMEFRLPYWDWETHRKIPTAFTSPNDNTNPLWNGTRAMGPNDEIPEEDVSDSVMEAALTAGTFAEFGGTATTQGIPEGAPHGSIHVDVGGDMGFFNSAARDPIFYAHHSNIDKMWSDWNKGSSTHTNPTDSSFLNLKWNFYDENKVWRSITAAQLLNHENQLRYTYGPSKFLEMLPCLLDWFVIRTDWRVSRSLKPAIEGRTKLTQALERGGRVRLHMNELLIPVDKSAVYRLYSSSNAAKADEGPGSKDYLGAFPVVLNDPENRHKHKNTMNVVVNVSKRTVEPLWGASAPSELAFVERGAKGGTRTAISVRAKDVHFSVADVER